MTNRARLIAAGSGEAVAVARQYLLTGAAAVVPTETIYGLTADAQNEHAVRNLFAIKRRALSRPVALYLASSAQIDHYASVESKSARAIIDRYLPGPLTVVLKSKIRSWPGIVGADGAIGFRVSSDPFIAKLTRACQRPLLATSANLAGQRNCRTVADLVENFATQVPLIVYKTEEMASRASTVVDLTGETPRVLRQGELVIATQRRSN